VWHSEGRRTSDGFIVLIAVPFRTLRFPSTKVQHWGMFFYRRIPRTGEVLYWPACSTRIAARFPQAAIVEGVEEVSPGRNLAVAPYAAARTFKVPRSPGEDTDGAIGLDAKAVIKDSLVIDATINPDFSQVESDQPQITVNKPFEAFFPEKRPFFLKNAAYFTTPIQLLFTRHDIRRDATNLTPSAGLPQAGRAFDATGTASLRLTRALTSDWSLPFDRLSDRESGRVIYSNAITRLRLGNQFTRATSLRMIVQHTRLDVDRGLTALPRTRNVNHDLLFTYLASPGTALYVGANCDLLDIGAAIETPAREVGRESNRGWQVFTKISYLFRR
jgi:hypothetical protein